MSAGPRIALFVDRFPVVSETFVVGEADALAALGARVSIEAHDRATPADPDAATRWPAAGFVAESGSAERLRALAWLVARHPRAVGRDLRARRRWAAEEWPLRLRELAPVARRLTRRGDEHLHAHFGAGAALSAMRVAALLGRPWSLTLHGYDLFLEPRNLPEKLARAAFTTTGSDFTLAFLRREYAPTRAHRVVMGVDPARFVRPVGSTPEAGLVVAVGRLVPKKGFAVLLDALAALPAARLVLVGDGPLRGELEAARDRLGLGDRVQLLGALPTAATRAQLLRASVVAVPAVIAPDGDADSMPVVVKEALALGTPVVASDAAGLPEIVRPPWGLSVPAGDVTALAAALADVLGRSPEERATMGAAGRAWVCEHANVRVEASRLLALIRAGA